MSSKVNLIDRVRLPIIIIALASVLGFTAYKIGGCLNPYIPVSEPVTNVDVKDIAALKTMLIYYEGEELTVYADSGGLTVGIGHHALPTDNLRLGQTISKDRSHAFFMQDVAKAITVATQAVDNFHSLNAARQNVIIGMVFQLGRGGVMSFQHFRASVNNGDYEQASLGMLYADIQTRRPSRWYQQTPKRCADMAEQMRTGKIVERKVQ